jgi:hypothetical protein
VREVPAGTWRKMRDQKIHERGNLEEYKHVFLVEDLTAVGRLTAAAETSAQRVSLLPLASGALDAFPVAQEPLPGLDHVFKT